MILAIQSNGRTIAIGPAEDFASCNSEAEADALRAKGYVPFAEGATTARPANCEETFHYYKLLWQHGGLLALGYLIAKLVATPKTAARWRSRLAARAARVPDTRLMVAG